MGVPTWGQNTPGFRDDETARRDNAWPFLPSQALGAHDMDELAGLWGACHIISVIGSPTSRAIPRKISPAIVNRDRTTTRSVNWIGRVDRRVPIIPIIPLRRDRRSGQRPAEDA